MVSRKYAADTLNAAFKAPGQYRQHDVVSVSAMEGIGVGSKLELHRDGARRPTCCKVSMLIISDRFMHIHDPEVPIQEKAWSGGL